MNIQEHFAKATNALEGRVRKENAKDDVRVQRILSEDTDIDGSSIGGGRIIKGAANAIISAGGTFSEQEKERKKKLNAALKLSSAIAKEIAAAEAAMRGYEDNFGGLDKMAEKLGLERKDDETEEEFRKRIREEITARQIAGTLDDPTGDFAGWAGEYDKIEAHKADIASKNDQTRQEYNALEGDEVGQKRVVSNGTDNCSISDATLQGGERLTQDKGIEYRERRDQGEYQKTDSSISFASKENSIENFFGGAEELDIKNTFNLQASEQAQPPDVTQKADISEPVINNKMIV